MDLSAVITLSLPSPSAASHRGRNPIPSPRTSSETTQSFETTSSGRRRRCPRRATASNHRQTCAPSRSRSRTSPTISTTCAARPGAKPGRRRTPISRTGCPRKPTSFPHSRRRSPIAIAPTMPLTDSSGAEPATGGKRRNKFSMLNWNLWHTWEHYGNVVVYLRMKELVPPSSEKMQGMKMP
jgi:hypothetical protein